MVTQSDKRETSARERCSSLEKARGRERREREEEAISLFSCRAREREVNASKHIACELLFPLLNHTRDLSAMSSLAGIPPLTEREKLKPFSLQLLLCVSIHPFPLVECSSLSLYLWTFYHRGEILRQLAMTRNKPNLHTEKTPPNTLTKGDGENSLVPFDRHNVNKVTPNKLKMCFYEAWRVFYPSLSLFLSRSLSLSLEMTFSLVKVWPTKKRKKRFKTLCLLSLSVWSLCQQRLIIFVKCIVHRLSTQSRKNTETFNLAHDMLL